mmetsp:Transcript_10431/g.42178  ORF Transcript_10431/g.42178 Transcript_10431/m.42178 type:complete len:210 (-) Transcript_10431:1003-1632(-)
MALRTGDERDSRRILQQIGCSWYAVFTRARTTAAWSGSNARKVPRVAAWAKCSMRLASEPTPSWARRRARSCSAVAPTERFVRSTRCEMYVVCETVSSRRAAAARKCAATRCAADRSPSEASARRSSASARSTSSRRLLSARHNARPVMDCAGVSLDQGSSAREISASHGLSSACVASSRAMTRRASASAAISPSLSTSWSAALFKSGK